MNYKLNEEYMKHKITFSKFKGFNNTVELDDVSVIISDFVKQNSNFKVCNVHPEGNALVGYIKDFDDFDYGTIMIEPVEV